MFCAVCQKYFSIRNDKKLWSNSNAVDHDDLQKSNHVTIYKSATAATLPIYGTVLLSTLPVTGVALFALMMSWSTIPIEIYPQMVTLLKYFTIAFQTCFAFASIFFWNVDGILTYVDVVFVLISPFADWYWIKVCNDFQKLLPNDIAAFSILIWYMIGRLWVKAVSPNQSACYRAMRNCRASKIDQLKFVWITRSASQVSEILPDIVMLWDLLVEKWGIENARKVCNISIHITDPNELCCAMLRKEYENTELYLNGGIRFRRPNIWRVIEDHTIELINSRVNSHSLLAFCGGASLSDEIQYNKISNDVITAMTGHYQSHMMDYVSESYGRKKASPSHKKLKREIVKLEIDHTNDDCVEVQLLTTRKKISYRNESCSCLSLPDAQRSFDIAA